MSKLRRSSRGKKLAYPLPSLSPSSPLPPSLSLTHHRMPNGNSNQISIFHSPEYLREHAEKSAATFKQTEEVSLLPPSSPLFFPLPSPLPYHSFFFLLFSFSLVLSSCIFCFFDSVRYCRLHPIRHSRDTK